MSTLGQIESAVAGLPLQEQWSLLMWLQGHLKAPAKMTSLPSGRTQAEMEHWLAELDELKAQTHTGKPGMPLQQMMDEIREDRF